MKIFLLMLLLHIIDDFVLQAACLNKLKQKAFWADYVTKDNKLYQYDYLVALFIHGLSWSLMVHLPFIFTDCNEWLLFGLIIFQAIIHSKVDDEKANKKTMNLVTDQFIHLMQIVMTALILL